MTPVNPDLVRRVTMAVITRLQQSAPAGEPTSLAAPSSTSSAGPAALPPQLVPIPANAVSPPTLSIDEAKSLICTIGTRIWQRGYCAGNDGNLSIRIAPDCVLCTPTGVSKGFMTPAMICLVDLDGKQVESIAPSSPWKRTSEILLHLAIYRQRPDVHAVIHAHPPHATAFAVAGFTLPDAVHPEADFLLGKVPLVEYIQTGKPQLGVRVAEVITPETIAVILANHGVVCLHTELTEAYHRLEVLENYCRMLLLLKQLEQVRRLSAAEFRELLELKASYGIADSRLPAARAGHDVRTASAFLQSIHPTPGSAGEWETLIDQVIQEVNGLT
ncbi:MAG: class II aldolase/adducin family protein [Phycisphaerae bacterium]